MTNLGVGAREIDVHTVTGISLDRFSLGNHIANRSRLIPVTVFVAFEFFSWRILYEFHHPRPPHHSQLIEYHIHMWFFARSLFTEDFYILFDFAGITFTDSPGSKNNAEKARAERQCFSTVIQGLFTWGMSGFHAVPNRLKLLRKCWEIPILCRTFYSSCFCTQIFKLPSLWYCGKVNISDVNQTFAAKSCFARFS